MRATACTLMSRATSKPRKPFVLSRAAMKAYKAEHAQIPYCRGTVELKEPLKLQYGGALPSTSYSWEQWGDLSLPGSRTIFIIPSFSHGPHVASNFQDRNPGWWEAMVGPGRYIDTNFWRVVSVSNLGSPFGSTCALSPLPDGSGKEYGISFPIVTPRDLATAHHSVLKELGISNVHAVVGSSMGGMLALQFAALFPDSLKRLVSISATGRTSPGTVMMRRVQRQAIMADAEWHGGKYREHGGTGPLLGMRVAREIGMMGYRSREEFDKRFDYSVIDTPTLYKPSFEVERYMEYQGKKFTSVYDPNCYLILSKCMDLMDLSHPSTASFEQGVLRIKAKTLVMGVSQDFLIPTAEMAAIARILRSHGRPASYQELNSIYGHDSFLKEIDWFGRRIKTHLESGLESALLDEAIHTTGLSSP